MGGVSLGVRTSSCFDMQESELLVPKYFGRRPDSSPLNQPESLTLTDFKLHEIESFEKRLNDRHNT